MLLCENSISDVYETSEKKSSRDLRKKQILGAIRSEQFIQKSY